MNIKCLILAHKWTCRATDGLGPLPEDEPKAEDTSEELIAKFKRYATMYCSRCGKT